MKIVWLLVKTHLLIFCVAVKVGVVRGSACSLLEIESKSSLMLQDRACFTCIITTLACTTQIIHYCECQYV